jgi:TM2 domain-containing membrane protein YozV
MCLNPKQFPISLPAVEFIGELMLKKLANLISGLLFAWAFAFGALVVGPARIWGYEPASGHYAILGISLLAAVLLWGVPERKIE